MEEVLEQKPAAFTDRRQASSNVGTSNTGSSNAASSGAASPNAAPSNTWAGGFERRQFGNSYNSAREEVNELAVAIDQYKLRHRRRFITFEELYDVMTGLGYHK